MAGRRGGRPFALDFPQITLLGSPRARGSWNQSGLSSQGLRTLGGLTEWVGAQELALLMGNPLSSQAPGHRMCILQGTYRSWCNPSF